MRPEGRKTQRENAGIDYAILATKVDVALQQFANCLCVGRFEEAKAWMALARKILRDCNGFDAVVRDVVEDPVRYVLNREHTPVPQKRLTATGNGFVVLNGNLQGQLKSVVSDSKWEVPICA